MKLRDTSYSCSNLCKNFETLTLENLWMVGPCHPFSAVTLQKYIVKIVIPVWNNNGSADLK